MRRYWELASRYVYSANAQGLIRNTFRSMVSHHGQKRGWSERENSRFANVRAGKNYDCYGNRRSVYRLHMYEAVLLFALNYAAWNVISDRCVLASYSESLIESGRISGNE